MEDFERNNAEVTLLIARAEEADRAAADLWERVAVYETRIAEHPRASQAEREVAGRGRTSALARAALLRQVVR